MRDPFELVEMVLYIVGVGLILPALATLDRESPWVILFGVVLLLPIPFYIARLRYVFPERIDAFFEQGAYLALFGGLIVLCSSLAMAGYRWLIAG